MTAPAPKRHVLVTGGGRGLGLAIVRTLATAGHDVTLTLSSRNLVPRIPRKNSPRKKSILPIRPRSRLLPTRSQIAVSLALSTMRANPTTRWP